jgi:Fur family transcriptional regulator, ferric uptake regulator
MCRACDYVRLLEKAGLDSTPNRVGVLEAIGGGQGPLSAQEVFTAVNRTTSLNRVTVYRILDLLVERSVVERISGGGRSFAYGLAPNENHPAHPHFRCRSCGALQCLQPGSLKVDLRGVRRSFGGEIHAVEVRVDGICGECLVAGAPARKGRRAV